MSRYNRYYFYSLLYISLLFLLVVEARADKIILKDGRVIRCDYAKEDGKYVRYNIGEATLTIAREKVERIERDNEKGEALEGNGSSTSPTGASAAARLADLPDLKIAPVQPAAGSSLSNDALDRLEANVKAEPNDANQRAALVNALLASASLEYQAGRYDQAKAQLSRALIYDGKNSYALTALATIEMIEGRYSEALGHARSASEIDPNDQRAHYLQGAAYYALEKLPEAVKAWKAALKIKNDPRIRAALEKAERELEVAGDFTKSKSRFFNISMEGGAPDPSLESSLLVLLEESYGQLKRSFEYEPKEKIAAIFYTRDTFFNITRAPNWAGAVNDGKLRVPIGGLRSVNDELAKTITHELAHSFVHFKARGKCPTWLNEGLAQMMEGKSAGGTRARVAALAAQGTLPTLQALSGSFIGLSTAQAEIAYAYALTATEVLSERGVRTVIAVLEDLGQNYNISVALQRHTRYQNLEAFEQEVRRRLTE